MRAQWTALAYLTGEKDLAEAMILSLKEMYRVGAASRCNVVVQFNPIDSPSYRFRLPPRAPIAACKVPYRDGGLRRSGEVVSGKRFPLARLESFVVSSIRENPSDHYLVILSGHGSGVLGRRIDQEGFSPGPLRTLELGPLFESVRRRTGRMVDVLGMDACFMSMGEVCWELRGAVRYLVSSEGLTPEHGWPYHRILELFRDGESLAPQELATEIVAKYLRYRADFDLAGQSVDLSACEIDRTEPLAAAVARLSHELLRRLEDPGLRDALILSHWKAQSYRFEQYVDLWDFCNLLGEHSRHQSVRSACHRVQSAISEPGYGIVKKSIYHGPAYQHSHGLSIYFPWSVVSPAYGRFGFAGATGWRRFLESYVSVTRREMRGDTRLTAC